MRMRRNLESLSFLLRSKCFLTATAFLIKLYKSSGISGASPLFLRRRRILLPVTLLTWMWLDLGNDEKYYYLLLFFKKQIPILITCAIPLESRRITPIWDGVRPFLASLHTWSSTRKNRWEKNEIKIMRKSE